MTADEDDPRVPATAPSPEVPAPEVEDEAVEPDDTDQEDAAAETTDAGDEPAGEQQRTERDKRNERYQRRAQRLEAEVAELRASLGSLRMENVDALVERAIGPPPRADDPKFQGDFLEYDRAKTVYAWRKEVKAEEIRNSAQRYQTANDATTSQKIEAFRERADEVREVIPDYDTAIKSATDAHVEKHVQDLVYESDEGPKVAYYLAKNRDVLESWNDMTPTQVARAIGQLEARMSSPRSPSQRTQTRAPAPIRPLTGGAAPPSLDRDLDTYISRKYGKRK
jgi:hypothetical protein